MPSSLDMPPQNFNGEDRGARGRQFAGFALRQRAIPSDRQPDRFYFDWLWPSRLAIISSIARFCSAVDNGGRAPAGMADFVDKSGSGASIDCPQAGCSNTPIKPARPRAARHHRTCLTVRSVDGA